MKKYILLGLLVFCAYLFWPIKEIYKLRDGYAFYHKRTQSYKIFSKRPRGYEALKNISTYASDAIVLSEDWSFFEHKGVDLSQLKKALNDYLDGRRKRGASTITQQLVKNLFLTPEKTFMRKAHEIFLALVVEKVIPKEKILESYLNIIHLGKDIYGIADGSKFYFGKKARYLNAKEGAFLAMLLPNPLKNNTSYKIKKLTPYGKKIVEDILWKMKVSKNISNSRYILELDEKIEFNENLESSKTF